VTNCQQDKVYDAQALAKPVTLGQPLRPTLEYVQGYLDTLTNEPWWHTRFPSVVTVECTALVDGEKSVGKAHDDGVGQIELSCHSLWERTLLHEVAHCTSGRDAAHGPAFVRDYLELVFRQLGTDAWVALSSAMKDAGVIW
jgi:putative metallohydrolase (TIGR04338 family)